MLVLLGLAAVAAAKTLYDVKDKIPDTGYDGEDEEAAKPTRPLPPRPQRRRSDTPPVLEIIPREIKLPAPKRPSSRAWESPIGGVTDKQWQQFCRVMGDPSNVNEVSKSGHVGFFRFSCPRLQELGFAVAARKVAADSGRKVWTADLLDAGFLSSGRSQLGAFEISCGDLATKIKGEHLLDAGNQVEPKPTLSGLLAVAHRAGFKGLQSWLKNPADRKKYPNTTKAFKDANGVF